jgi:hypothetical protein
MKDYKVTIVMLEDIRNYFHDKWGNDKRGIRWSDYIGEIINKALEVIKDNES